MLLPRDMYIYLTHRHADRQIEGRGREREGRRQVMESRVRQDRRPLRCALSFSLSLSLSLSVESVRYSPHFRAFAIGIRMWVFNNRGFHIVSELVRD